MNPFQEVWTGSGLEAIAEGGGETLEGAVQSVLSSNLAGADLAKEILRRYAPFLRHRVFSHGIGAGLAHAIRQMPGVDERAKFILSRAISHLLSGAGDAIADSDAWNAAVEEAVAQAAENPLVKIAGLSGYHEIRTDDHGNVIVDNRGYEIPICARAKRHLDEKVQVQDARPKKDREKVQVTRYSPDEVMQMTANDPAEICRDCQNLTRADRPVGNGSVSEEDVVPDVALWAKRAFIRTAHTITADDLPDDTDSRRAEWYYVDMMIDGIPSINTREFVAFAQELAQDYRCDDGSLPAVPLSMDDYLFMFAFIDGISRTNIGFIDDLRHRFRARLNRRNDGEEASGDALQGVIDGIGMVLIFAMAIFGAVLSIGAWNVATWCGLTVSVVSAVLVIGMAIVLRRSTRPKHTAYAYGIVLIMCTLAYVSGIFLPDPATGICVLAIGTLGLLVFVRVWHPFLQVVDRFADIVWQNNVIDEIRDFFTEVVMGLLLCVLPLTVLIWLEAPLASRLYFLALFVTASVGLRMLARRNGWIEQMDRRLFKVMGYLYTIILVLIFGHAINAKFGWQDRTVDLTVVPGWLAGIPAWFVDNGQLNGPGVIVICVTTFVICALGMWLFAKLGQGDSTFLKGGLALLALIVMGTAVWNFAAGHDAQPIGTAGAQSTHVNKTTKRQSQPTSFAAEYKKRLCAKRDQLSAKRRAKLGCPQDR